MTYLTEEQYQDRKDLLRGASTTMLWKNIDPESVDGAYKLTYEEEKALYIWFISRLLKDGDIKLARHGKFLSGSIEKQIEVFEMAFPKTEDDMDCDAFEGFWFLSENCPAGIVWIYENGYQDWT
ncbi:Uncharacterized protein conserved in bacteria [Klebsiella variicola]|uniref:DUF596 domain-containing protein n=3 Tax=Klebsiella/Raoultella group TaxID=2890311 RepID=A0A9P0VCM2_KLEVA|nr:hypothetical protein AI3070V1_5022 [Klebsiella pneumoniae]CAH6255946.1 hypothetical protein AN2335V1_4918 [Klebsiella variicola]CAH6266355.1 hypothetical protein AI3070V1_5022 [Klebsiella pneumoniae]CTQ19707.1 conserved hypothetical protein [Klebsiella variicola]SXE52605.1 Uncharacterized protein conserved in bacteria [Klebsiella variicola]